MNGLSESHARVERNRQQAINPTRSRRAIAGEAMEIPVRCGLFSGTGVLALAVAVVLGIAGVEPASATTNITVGPGVVVLPLGARTQLGFQFGPVDGVMGGVK